MQYLFAIEESYSCYFNPEARLVCEGSNQCEKLIVEATSITLDKWFHVTVSGDIASDHAYLRIDLSNKMQEYVEARYIYLEQTTDPWYAKIAISLQD